MLMDLNKNRHFRLGVKLNRERTKITTNMRAKLKVFVIENERRQFIESCQNMGKVTDY